MKGWFIPYEHSNQSENKCPHLRAELSKAQEATVNAEKFMNVVRKYASFEELTSIETDVNQNSGICDTLTDQNYAMVETALTAGTMPTDSHSIVIHDKIVAHFCSLCLW